MNKKLIIIGIALILVSIGLSGCIGDKYMKFRIQENASDTCMYCTIKVDGDTVYTQIEVCGNTILDVNEEERKYGSVKDFSMTLLDDEPHTISVDFYTYHEYWHLWEDLYRGSHEETGLIGNIEIIFNSENDIIIREWSS